MGRKGLKSSIHSSITIFYVAQSREKKRVEQIRAKEGRRHERKIAREPYDCEITP